MSSLHPLLTEIRLGESKTLEFKVTLPKGEQVARTLVAFANGSGGKLVIGVNDQRQLIGLQGADIFDLQDTIASIAHERCSPSLLPEIYVENVNGTELLVVEVTRGSLLPYYLKRQGHDHGTYIRLGSTNRLASHEHVQELERQRLNISFDEQIDFQQSVQELNLNPLHARFQTAGKILDDYKLRNLKLIRQQQGKDYPTHGLMILLGLYEHVEIKCSRFRGNNMAVFLDKKEYNGDLFHQLEQAELFIKNHLHLKAEILGLQRTETYEIPLPAIREALLNAILHRDYSNFGRDIKIGIYDDLLNIVSPGGLPNGLTQADLHQGRSEIRNRVLARVFKELSYIEQWGSGISRIQQLCKETGNAAPRIREQNDFVDWEFYRTPPYRTAQDRDSTHTVQEDTLEKARPIGGSIGYPISGSIQSDHSLSARQQEVLVLISQNPRTSYRKMAEFLDINESAIKKHLNKLKAAGWLQRKGGTRGYWKITKPRTTPGK